MDKTTSQQMLAHAEKLCAQRGVRLTPQRLEVLRLMSLQQGAISGETADGIPGAGVYTGARVCA